MKFPLYALAGVLVLAGCSAASEPTKTDSGTAAASSPEAATTVTNTDTDDTEEESKDDDIEISAQTVTQNKIDLSDYDTNVKIGSAGTYTVTGSFDHMLIIDAKKQDVTVVLDNVDIHNESGPCIYVKKAASVTFTLEGDSSLTSGSSYEFDTLNACLYSKGDAVFEGDGSLTINAGYEHGMKLKDTAVFNGGTYNITAQNDGIHVNETADFNAGTYNITASGEGIESKDVLNISGGTYNVVANDDGINAASELNIRDGILSITSYRNDAVDSNGALVISGGEVTAIAMMSPECAFDVDNTTFAIAGGTVLGIGPMMTSPTNTSQPVLLIGGSGSVSSIEIRQGSTVVASWSVSGYSSNAGSTNITLSSPAFKAGETYTIYVNGSEFSDVTLSDGITTLGNIQTMGGGMMGGGRPGMNR